jgi:hypothetical protein
MENLKIEKIIVMSKITTIKNDIYGLMGKYKIPTDEYLNIQSKLNQVYNFVEDI